MVTLVGMSSKLPAYHQMCATMSWLAVKFLLVIKETPDWERVRTIGLGTSHGMNRDCLPDWERVQVFNI